MNLILFHLWDQSRWSVPVATGGDGEALFADREVSARGEKAEALPAGHSLGEGWEAFSTSGRAGRGALAAESLSLELSFVWLTKESGKHWHNADFSMKSKVSSTFIFS